MITALAANLIYLEIGYNGTLYFYVVVAYGLTMVGVNALYPWLAGKLGRRKLQNVSIAAAILGYLVIAAMGWTSFFPFNIWLLCAFCILVSAGQSLFYMTCIINMANCVEYNDFKYGERNEAVVSTLRPFMAKFASAMHTLLVTLVLTISGAFLLSQSISTLETQHDFFDRMDESGQAYYITEIKGYLEAFDGVTSDTPEYDAALETVSAEISANEVMNKYQLDAKYVPAMDVAMVVKITTDGKTVELGRLGDFDTAQMVNDGSKYPLVIDDLKSGQERRQTSSSATRAR